VPLQAWPWRRRILVLKSCVLKSCAKEDAGEGEEAFVAAVRAVEAEEAGGEVAAAEEVADGGEDVGAERTEGGTVELFVTSEEGVPGGGENLPQWRGPGAAGLVNGWHKECS